MSATQVVMFWVLAVVTVGCGLYVVAARNIVHAGFALFPFFLGVAGLFATLDAHFFVYVQVLIYASAILILILFALMLTRDVMNQSVPQTNRMGLWAGLICAGATVGASYMVGQHPWPMRPTGQIAGGAEQARVLGEALIGPYALPFEVASLLLLAALVGAIVIAKSEREPAPDLPPLAPESAAEREPAGVA